jgi:hypothetical protein
VEIGSQEQVRSQAENTTRGEKARGRRGREGVPERSAKKNPKEESSGGDRVGRDLNHHVSQRIHAGSKALKAGAGLWRIRATGCRGFGQRQEGNGE